MSRGFGFVILDSLRDCEQERDRHCTFQPDSYVCEIRAIKIFLNTIVSGKVTRKGKVKVANSLSELARDLDITQ